MSSRIWSEIAATSFPRIFCPISRTKSAEQSVTRKLTLPENLPPSTRSTDEKDPMIARIWHGMVPASKADDYLNLMPTIALPEYLAMRGNRGAWCLYRTEADVTHFEMLTFWDDTDAIKRFAGDDYNLAKYYDFDPDYLLEMEPTSGITRWLSSR